MKLDDANWKEFIENIKGCSIEDVKIGYSFFEIDLSSGKTLVFQTTNEKTTKHQSSNDLEVRIE